MRNRFVLFLAASLFSLMAASAASAHIKVGDPLPEFRLKTLDGHIVSPSQFSNDPLWVLVVLRGWPGYQCPICTRQVHDFVAHAQEFRDRNIPVVMIYPGPAKQLEKHARDFLHDKDWPANYTFLMDPDYTFINACGLRWNEPRETAYPSTFIVDRSRVIRFAHVSATHGNRVGAEEALKVLLKLGR